MSNDKLKNLAYALAAAIIESGRAGIPSGHLYAVAMARGVTLDEYTTALDALKHAGLVVESRSHLLTIDAGSAAARRIAESAS